MISFGTYFRNLRISPSGGRASHHQSKGFTAIELLMVIALMSIFGVIALSTWNPTETSSHTAMLKVAHDIRYAQQRAMATGTNHGFSLVSSTTYQIYEGAVGSPTLDPTTRKPMQIDLSVDYGGVTFFNGPRVEFNNLGAPIVGSGVTFILRQGALDRSFKITENTGVIQFL